MKKKLLIFYSLALLALNVHENLSGISISTKPLHLYYTDPTTDKLPSGSDSTLLSAEAVKDHQGTTIEYRIKSIYGNSVITEPILIDIIESKAFQRLKHIHQYAQHNYFIVAHHYTRYTHSLGVFMIVRMSGGSLVEQVAALLHDISHTAFSHAGSRYFDRNYKTADYAHDRMHLEFISRTDLIDILIKHNLSIDPVDRRKFARVKDRHQKICADNISYILEGAVINHLITYNNAKKIFSHLHFNGTEWYFDDPLCAFHLAELCLKKIFGWWFSPENILMLDRFGRILRHAGEIGVVTRDMMILGTDDMVWEQLLKCNDAFINQELATLRNWRNLYAFVNPEEGATGELIRGGKFMAIDPLVRQTDGSLQKLSDISPVFKDELAEARRLFDRGWIVVKK